MSDTQYLDNAEINNYLLKKDYKFPSTSENKQWYEETAVKFNEYFNGENLFLDPIPENPDFDINGIVKTASELNLNTSDFVNYNDNSSNKASCSIVDDSTGVVRRYRLVILEECPQLGSDAGASWFKLDSSDNNIMKNSFQFNFKQYTQNGITYQPYLYSLFTQQSLSTSSPNLPFGSKGGNWAFDIQSGILLFSDFNNFSNGVQTKSEYQINVTNNKPVISFYKYIGARGISNFLSTQPKEYFNIYQIASTNIIQGISDEIIESTNYRLINDLSLNLIAKQNNSKYKILLNFNYLSSNYYDTLLKIGLYYKLNNNNEILIGEYLLGNENTSFKYDFFSNNFSYNINSNINDNINFYIKAKIVSNNLTDSDYNNLDEIYKPKLILSSPGNILNIEEINL